MNIIKSKIFLRLFFALVFSFILSGSLNVWRISRSVEHKIHEQTSDNKKLNNIAESLDVCYSVNLDTSKCLETLKTFDNQITKVDFKTKKLQMIRTLTYSYLLSVNIPVENQVVLINLTVNNDLIDDSFNNFVPINSENVEKFRSKLKQKYLKLIKEI